MWDSSEEPCCIGYVTSGGRDDCHEPDCPDRLPTRREFEERARDNLSSPPA